MYLYGSQGLLANYLTPGTDDIVLSQHLGIQNVKNAILSLLAGDGQNPNSPRRALDTGAAFTKSWRLSGSALMIIDSHAHLHFDRFDEDRTEVIKRAHDAGVTHMVTIGTHRESSPPPSRWLSLKHLFLRRQAYIHSPLTALKKPIGRYWNLFGSMGASSALARPDLIIITRPRRRHFSANCFSVTSLLDRPLIYRWSCTFEMRSMMLLTCWARTCQMRWHCSLLYWRTRRMRKSPGLRDVCLDFRHCNLQKRQKTTGD